MNSNFFSEFTMNIPEELQNVSLFQGMSREEIAAALDYLHAVRRRCLAGETILREGDPVRYAGIVLSGSIQVMREDYNGNRDIINSMAAPGLFGEALCFCGEEFLNVSITAREDCDILLLRLKGAELGTEEVFQRKLLENLLREISSKVLFLTQKNMITSQRTTREKLLAFFRSESRRCGTNEFDLTFSRQELADFLGVERSAMITELSRLKKQGEVQVSGRHIALCGAHPQENGAHIFCR